MPTHYETLGISKDATEKEIKQAFRAMSMKYHPDKVQNKTPEDQEEANRKADAKQRQPMLPAAVAGRGAIEAQHGRYAGAEGGANCQGMRGSQH